MDRAFWEGVAASGYAVPEGCDAGALALEELLPALGSTDAELRDALAFSTLERWIRDGALTPEQMRGLLAELATNLTHGLGERDTDTVFLRSFSVLTLAVIVYRDNQAPFLEQAEVRQLLEVALVYLEAERDLRGWVPGKGWAHSVAHTADLLYMLAQSRYLDASDMNRIVDAIGAKLRAGGAFYVCGEDERLARVVLAGAGRGLLTPDGAAEWLARLTRPLAEMDWMDGEGAALDRTLAVHHNVKLFARSLFFALERREDRPPELDMLRDAVLAEARELV